MGGRGARSELYDIMYDKPYGTEYTCVATIGKCKIIRFRDGKQSKIPMETRTRGRIYAVINKNEDISSIVFYDKKNKRSRQIDIRGKPHMVNGIPVIPHVHIGYRHGERGTREPSPRERKLITWILKYWEKKRSNNNVR